MLYLTGQAKSNKAASNLNFGNNAISTRKLQTGCRTKVPVKLAQSVRLQREKESEHEKLKAVSGIAELLIVDAEHMAAMTLDSPRSHFSLLLKKLMNVLKISEWNLTTKTLRALC